MYLTVLKSVGVRARAKIGLSLVAVPDIPPDSSPQQGERVALGVEAGSR